MTVSAALVEAHALDVRTAKKIQKAVIGRALTLNEAAALLDRLKPPVIDLGRSDRTKAANSLLVHNTTLRLASWR